MHTCIHTYAYCMYVCIYLLYSCLWHASRILRYRRRNSMLVVWEYD